MSLVVTKQLIEKNLITHSSLIKKQLEKVFGKGIIKDCYLVTYKYNNEKSEELQKRKDHSLKNWENNYDPRGLLSLDVCDIIVTFVNSHSINLTVSEWCHMAEINTKQLLKSLNGD